MTHRFARRMLPAIFLLNGILSPCWTLAADEAPAGASSAVSAVEDSAAVAPSPISEEPGFLKSPAASVPETQSLTALFGRSEISVLERVDWQFVKSMDETQVLGEEFATQAGDTDLSRSIRAGRSFSRESLAAEARTEQAKARTGQAFGLLLPEVTVRANYGTETSAPSVELDDKGNAIPKDTHDRTDVAWTVRQPLFDLPSYLDWRRRQVIEQASQESYRVSDGDAYIATTNAYLTLVSTRLHTDLTRDFEKQLDDLLRYIEKRAKGGAASVSDMARVRARSQETLSFRLEQEAAHEAAGIDFVRLTNLVPSRVRLPEFADIGADNLPKSFGAAVAVAMQNNPEVAGLAAEIKAADIDRKTAKSQFLPRLDAEYTDTYSQHAGGDTESDGQRDKRGMLVLSWSPLSGGRDYQYYLERTARHKELQYRFDDERRRVVQALSANYSTLAITKERIRSGYKELKSISLAVEAMSKRMLSGNQSLLDLLDVFDRFYQARSRLVDLHILEMYTMAQLVRLTTGTPWVIAAEGAPLAAAEPEQRPASLPEKRLEVTVANAQPSPAPVVSPASPVKTPPAPEPVAPVVAPLETRVIKPEPVPTPAPATVEAAAPVADATVLAKQTAVAAPVPPQSNPGIDAAPPAPPRAVPAVVVAPVVTAPRAEQTVVVNQPAAVKSPPAEPASAPVAPAGTRSDGAGAVDDAYAPLWLDIIPQTGTALAVKSFGETAGSAVAGVSAAPAPYRGAATAVSATAGGLTLGLLDSGDQARIDRLVTEVSGRLGAPVKVQLFASEESLVKWFRGLGVVDLVVVPVGERGDLLAGDYALLQALPQGAASPRREILVARRDLPSAQLARLTQLFATPINP